MRTRSNSMHIGTPSPTPGSKVIIDIMQPIPELTGSSTYPASTTRKSARLASFPNAINIDTTAIPQYFKSPSIPLSDHNTRNRYPIQIHQNPNYYSQPLSVPRLFFHTRGRFGSSPIIIPKVGTDCVDLDVGVDLSDSDEQEYTFRNYYFKSPPVQSESDGLPSPLHMETKHYTSFDTEYQSKYDSEDQDLVLLWICHHHNHIQSHLQYHRPTTAHRYAPIPTFQHPHIPISGLIQYLISMRLIHPKRIRPLIVHHLMALQHKQVCIIYMERVIMQVYGE